MEESFTTFRDAKMAEEKAFNYLKIYRERIRVELIQDGENLDTNDMELRKGVREFVYKFVVKNLMD